MINNYCPPEMEIITLDYQDILTDAGSSELPFISPTPGIELDD